MTPALLEASRKRTCSRASSGARWDAAQRRYKRRQNNFLQALGHLFKGIKGRRKGSTPTIFQQKTSVSLCL